MDVLIPPPQLELHPFWRYFGGKWRLAPRYPAPRHRTIIEPFAGAAGYALRHYTHDVILVERFATIAEIWRWLIAAPSSEVRRVPLVEAVDELPSWVSEGARALVGFNLNAASTVPCRTLSSGLRAHQDRGWKFSGWTQATRERVAVQVQQIRHWKILEGDYRNAPEIEATWFVDPPYANAAGSRYAHHDLDRGELASWCRARRGQVIVCENEGADYLPFRPLALAKGGPRSSGSAEVIWTNEE